MLLPEKEIMKFGREGKEIKRCKRESVKRDYT